MSRLRVVAGVAVAAVLAAAHAFVLGVLAAGSAAAHGEGGPPAKGSYQVVADEVPAGVTVTMLQGSTAGVLLRASGARTVEVLGSRGETLARATPGDPQVAWVDPRLRTPVTPPAEPGQDAVVGRWAIPLQVDGRPHRLSGELRWVSLGYPRHDHTAWYATWPATAGAVGLLLGAGIAFVLVVDRSRRPVSSSGPAGLVHPGRA